MTLLRFEPTIWSILNNATTSNGKFLMFGMSELNLTISQIRVTFVR